MRIEFEFAGGYGGLFAKQPLALRLDTDALAEDERTELMRLIQASGLLEMAPTAPQGRPGQTRDAFAYRLTLRDEATDKSFAFDDATAPASVHPLLADLRRRAMTHKLSGG